MVDIPSHDAEEPEEKKEPEEELEVIEEADTEEVEADEEFDEPNFSSFEDIKAFAMDNKYDTIAYVVMFVGLLLTIFGNFTGAVMVGLVIGSYYSEFIVDQLKLVTQRVETEGIFKSFVLGGTALAFFIASPGIFLGMGISVIAKFFMFPKQKQAPEAPKEEE